MTRRLGPLGTAALLVGFTASILVRMAIGGAGIARSATAGLVFAGCLAALTLVTGATLGLRPKAVVLGLAGAALLCLPSLVGHTLHPGVRPGGSFAHWAVVVTVVAVAEEAFLRGALYTAVRDLRGETAALLVTATAFAALHLPLYGWGSAPLDFAVGLVLGVLREQTGGWAAPAVTHVVADLAAWGLR
ncbi:MAG: protease family protein [Frankiales bacterium]|nr:protease family protein [Frankiales bacterium]